MSRVEVVTGAAFGSEGKGHITAQIVEKYAHQMGSMVLNVRVAGPNAGHTVLDDSLQSFALRQVPVGAAVDDWVHLYIAPGSEIDLPVLVDEIEKLRAGGHAVSNLYVSGEATLIEDEHKQEEADRQLNARLGSTAKGIGAAREARLGRRAKRLLDDQDAMLTLANLGVTVLLSGEDVKFMDNWLNDNHAAIVVEGTQGYGLGLHAGYYPYTTSSNCRAIDFLAMSGINPWHPAVENVGVWLVARVFPIRVAGNSGPLKDESSWDELGLPEEFTTVTKKTRRVGQWDSELVCQAVIANGGPSKSVFIALTMVDQKFPTVANLDNESLGSPTRDRSMDPDLMEFIKRIEDECLAQVAVIGTGPNTVVWKGGF